MFTDWAYTLRRAGPALAVGIAFALFRRYLRPRTPPSEEPLDMVALGERYRTTVWVVGLAEAVSVLLVGYFTYRLCLWGNQALARADGQGEFTLLPQNDIWIFFPGFLALTTPWEVVRFFWKSFGDRQEMKIYESWGNQKMGFDGPRVLRWMILILAGPIGVFTILALPMHKTLQNDQILDRGFASLRPTIHRYVDASAVAQVEGYRLKDGTWRRRQELLIKFAGNAVWESSFSGDDIPLPDGLAQFVGEKTQLPVQSAQTQDDLSW